VIVPEESIDFVQDGSIEIAISPEDRDRIDHLLSRYDSVLAQAEDLSAQIESLLKVWNPPSTDTKRSHD
jgi:hypothetical protein